MSVKRHDASTRALENMLVGVDVAKGNVWRKAVLEHSDLAVRVY